MPRQAAEAQASLMAHGAAIFNPQFRLKSTIGADQTPALLI
jgi:hypothetical protein